VPCFQNLLFLEVKHGRANEKTNPIVPTGLHNRCASLLKLTTSGAECAEEEIVTVTSRPKRELEEADAFNFGSDEDDDAIAILFATQFLLLERRIGLRICNYFVQFCHEEPPIGNDDYLSKVLRFQDSTGSKGYATADKPKFVAYCPLQIAHLH
jgi:hypothetical protein